MGLFPPVRCLADIRHYKVLTSPWVVASFTIGLPLSFIVGLFSLEAGLLLGSISAAALLCFVFASTYYPNIPPPTPMPTSFSLLLHLGEYAQIGTPEALATAGAYLLTLGGSRAILDRLQLNNPVLPVWSWEEFAHDMLKVATDLKSQELTPIHALGSFLLHPAMRTYLRSQQLTEQDIRFALWWELAQQQERGWRREWWRGQRLRAVAGLGLSWAAGYTPLIDRLARLPRGSFWDANAFGHEEQVEQLMNTLARARQSNAMLVGPPGVGRLGIIKEMARRVRAQQAHPALLGQRVAYLHMGELLAMAANQGGQAAVISRALREMERAGNIIAVFDGFGSVLGQGVGKEADLTDVLLPFFDSSFVRVVVVMTSEEYHLRLAANQELAHYFEVIQVPEPSPEATLQKLAVTVPGWEQESSVYLPYKTLREAVTATEPILPDIPFPEKAFDIIEEAIVMVQTNHETVVRPAHIQKLIAHKTGMRIGDITGQEEERLLRLEETIHQRVINQAPAVTALARAMIRARAGVRSPGRPIGVFLFLGPTGVGKTETSKALAAAYFGREEAMIRLDMSEFEGDDAVARLIGDMNHPAGRLTSLLSDHPFTVVLLDEFEKASQAAQQVFLQVFDEGRLTDVRGRHFSFKQAIIIVTSNAGAEFIRQEVKDGQMPADFDKQLRDYILQHDIYSPELLNRFDGVITFIPLSPEHIAQIATLMLRSLNKRLDAKHGVTVAITPELVTYLVSIGYNPEFGARPMARAIADTVEYAIAQKILRHEIKPGQEIVLPVEELQV